MDIKALMHLLDDYKKTENHLRDLEARISAVTGNGKVVKRTRRRRLTGFAAEVMKFFRTHKGKVMKVDEIRKEMGVDEKHYKTLTATLSTMTSSGYLTRVGYGVYKLK